MLPVHPAILVALAVVLVAAVVLIFVAALCRAAALGDRLGHGPDDHTLRFDDPASIRARGREERLARSELRPRTGLVEAAPRRRPS